MAEQERPERAGSRPAPTCPSASPVDSSLALPRRAAWIAFYGLSYTPFCMSLLLHVAVTSTPVDPSAWTAERMKPYWIAAIGTYGALLAYAVGAPFFWTGRGHASGGMGTMIWPMLGPTLAFHILTIRYAHLRPELKKATVIGRKLRWRCPRNWLGVLFAMIEFAQLLSIPFSGNIDWLPGGTVDSSAFVEAMQVFLRTFLVVAESEIANLIFSMLVVGLFAFLVGEFITSKRCASDPMAAILYELLSGGLFLTTLGSTLRVASVATLARRQIAVFVGLLLYTTPSIFVSVYRGDLRKIRGDITYAPILLARERVAKEAFAITVVYILPPSDAVGQLISAISLGVALLWVLRDSDQSSCQALVRIRRILIGISTWSSMSGLVVVTGNGDAGRVLLCTGWSLLLLFVLFQLLKSWNQKCGGEINIESASDDDGSETASERGVPVPVPVPVPDDRIEAPYGPNLHVFHGDSVVNQDGGVEQQEQEQTVITETANKDTVETNGVIDQRLCLDE